jgi:hypothetical protein
MKRTLDKILSAFVFVLSFPPRNSLSQRTVAFCVCSVFFWIPDIPPPEKSLLAGFWDDAKNGAGNGNRTRVSAMARPRNSHYTIPARANRFYFNLTENSSQKFYSFLTNTVWVGNAISIFSFIKASLIARLMACCVSI